MKCTSGVEPSGPSTVVLHLIAAMIFCATATTFTAHAQGNGPALDPKAKAGFSIELEVQASDSQLDQLAKLAGTVAKAAVKKAATGTLSIPLWDLYTGANNFISGYVSEIIGKGDLCRHALLAMADVTRTTNRQKWAEIKITYVPKAGSSKKPVTVTAYVFFTAAYTGGSVRIHVQDASGNILKEFQYECKAPNIPAYG